MTRLDWEGAWNVRDLGGLPAAGGHVVRPGAIVRADTLDGLTARGWAALVAHGVRTIVDLRNDDERDGEREASRPDSVETVHVPVDGVEDREFWDAWDSEPGFGTPAYYAAHLERLPERSAAAVRAVARARPGGVVVHCVSGRDRTGLIVALVLALVGVPAAAIVEDYARSAARLAARAAALGEVDPGVELAVARGAGHLGASAAHGARRVRSTQRAARGRPGRGGRRGAR